MMMLTGEERAFYVRGIFARIAGNYDRMNRLMTGGQDRHWRVAAVRHLELQAGQRVLDLGTGTGDLAREIRRQNGLVKVNAADFTLQMMLTGQARGELPFLCADALHLPYPDRVFSGIVSGFLMRNVGDLGAALLEQYRVLVPGGRLVILETTRPGRNLLSPFIWLHMHVVIPLLGGLISGFREAYRYLPDSSEQFLSAEVLSERVQAAGFAEIHFQRLMFGTIALHWAIKPQ
jgi:ubiquinone/menaquinone biosynthesis methyltransferases